MSPQMFAENFVADWPVVRPTCTTVSGGVVIREKKDSREGVLTRVKRRAPAPRRGHSTVSAACRGCGARLSVARNARRGDSAPASTTDPSNVRLSLISKRRQEAIIALITPNIGGKVCRIQPENAAS
jgi:hypothetical protein